MAKDDFADTLRRTILEKVEADEMTYDEDLYHLSVTLGRVAVMASLRDINAVRDVVALVGETIEAEAADMVDYGKKKNVF